LAIQILLVDVVPSLGLVQAGAGIRHDASLVSVVLEQNGGDTHATCVRLKGETHVRIWAV
jgi:hypothetical protein